MEVTREVDTTPAETIPKRATVLVVDDDPIIRALIAEALEADSHKVVVAENGSAALESVAAGLRPDLLVTDLVMPDLSGDTLSHEVQLISPQTKILFMSGYLTAEIAARSVLIPNLPFIEKPFALSHLQDTVNALLNGGLPASPFGHLRLTGHEPLPNPTFATAHAG